MQAFFRFFLHHGGDVWTGQQQTGCRRHLDSELEMDLWEAGERLDEGMAEDDFLVTELILVAA